MESTPKATRPRILVVGRYSGVHQVARSTFGGSCDVEHAYSGFLAITRLEASPFDLIIAMLDLPREYRGAKILEAIRGTESGRGASIVALLEEEQWVDGRLREAAGKQRAILFPREIQRFEDVRMAVERLLPNAQAKTPIGGAIAD